MRKPEYSWDGYSEKSYVILSDLAAMDPHEVIELLDGYWDLLEQNERGQIGAPVWRGPPSHPL